ncbi:hypothetical protein BV25DRAFT_1917759 [Artomyces pyxidatus]|uniref:Uncharacterized protein n=1 Tax=Artomyces pyxidatus TaxID=48021 RepID=A0ACB8SVB9_9AGAM|nr:hypothetical protein BV25DRAFT_1917759 [Artomyces pyxidatus]
MAEAQNRRENTSDDSFDALIDLLATDDAQDPFNQIQAVNGSGGLRDNDGKLDFVKIKSLLSRTVTSDSDLADPQNIAATNQTAKVKPHTVSFASRNVKNGQVSPIPRPLNFVESESPAPTIIPPAPSHPSHPETEKFEDGSEITDPRLKADLKNGTESIPEPIDPRDLLLYDLDKALTLAHQEVADLRDRCNELQSLVSRLVTVKPSSGPADRQRDHRGQGPDGKAGNTPLTGAGRAHATSLPPSLDVDVDSLSEEQAKNHLSELLTALSLPHRVHSNGSDSSPSHQIDSVTDVHRALKFLIQADELVWRRSQGSSTASSALGEYLQRALGFLMGAL